MILPSPRVPPGVGGGDSVGPGRPFAVSGATLSQTTDPAGRQGVPSTTCRSGVRTRDNALLLGGPAGPSEGHWVSRDPGGVFRRGSRASLGTSVSVAGRDRSALRGPPARTAARPSRLRVCP